LLAVRIKQKFMVIETMALLGSVWTVNSVSVQLAWARLREVTMPDHVGLLEEWNARGLSFARSVEQTQLHLLGVLRVEREVYALSVPR